MFQVVVALGRIDGGDDTWVAGSGVICDEVGLGKTVETGLVMMEYLLRGLVKRVLILTPPSLIHQWQEEMFQKFNQDFVTIDSADFTGTVAGLLKNM